MSSSGKLPGFELSLHALNMVVEREIMEEWVWRALRSPDRTFSENDGTIHYIKAIVERDNRVLRVIVNPGVDLQRIITIFFDRRLREKE
jgi:hypothetical protein